MFVGKSYYDSKKVQLNVENKESDEKNSLKFSRFNMINLGNKKRVVNQVEKKQLKAIKEIEMDEDDFEIDFGESTNNGKLSITDILKQSKKRTIK